MSNPVSVVVTAGVRGPAGPPGAGGSSLVPTAVKTANYTAAISDFVPANTSGGAFAITLPTAPVDKAEIAVKLITAGNTLTITAGGSDVFNKAGGSTSLTLTLLNQGVLLQYAHATGIWYVLSDDVTLAALDARYIALGAAGVANGVATLDGGTKLTGSQLPNSVVSGVSASGTLVGTEDLVLADATGTAAPTGLGLTVSASGGTFAAGDYYWLVTATPPGGSESVGSNLGGTDGFGTVGANGSVALAWTAVAGSGAGWVYKAYRIGPNPTTLAGFHTAPALVATLGNVTTYTDTGTAVGAGTVPLPGITLKLPTTPALRRPMTIKSVTPGNRTTTLTGQDGQTIDGAASITIGGPASGAQYLEATVLQGSDTNWSVTL